MITRVYIEVSGLIVDAYSEIDTVPGEKVTIEYKGEVLDGVVLYTTQFDTEFVITGVK